MNGRDHPQFVVSPSKHDRRTLSSARHSPVDCAQGGRGMGDTHSLTGSQRSKASRALSRSRWSCRPETVRGQGAPLQKLAGGADARRAATRRRARPARARRIHRGAAARRLRSWAPPGAQGRAGRALTHNNRNAKSRATHVATTSVRPSLCRSSPPWPSPCAALDARNRQHGKGKRPRRSRRASARKRVRSASASWGCGESSREW